MVLLQVNIVFSENSRNIAFEINHVYRMLLAFVDLDMGAMSFKIAECDPIPIDTNQVVEIRDDEQFKCKVILTKKK